MNVMRDAPANPEDPNQRVEHHFDRCGRSDRGSRSVRYGALLGPALARDFLRARAVSTDELTICQRPNRKNGPSPMLAGSAGNKSVRPACDYLDMIGCIVHTAIVYVPRNLPPWPGDSKLSSSFVAAHFLAGLMPQIAWAQHITIDDRLTRRRRWLSLTTQSLRTSASMLGTLGQVRRGCPPAADRGMTRCKSTRDRNRRAWGFGPSRLLQRWAQRAPAPKLPVGRRSLPISWPAIL